MGSHARRAAEVADIFISLTRNENSAMTVGGDGGLRCRRGEAEIRGTHSFRFRSRADGVGCQAALGETHSQAALGNDRGAALGNDRGAALGNDMSRVLAVESGGGRFSVALGGGEGEVFFRVSCLDSLEHSRVALPMVREALAEGGVELADCEAFAFGAGPGRFSGLRMSCAFAQCFAHATGAKLVSVSSLAALAEMNFGGSERVALAALPAHRGHAYLASCKRGADGVWRAEAARVVCEDDFAAEDAAEFWGGENLCGEGWTARPKLRGFFAGNRVGDFPLPDARPVLRLARGMLARGETISPMEAAPVYAREKIALTKAERESGKIG